MKRKRPWVIFFYLFVKSAAGAVLNHVLPAVSNALNTAISVSSIVLMTALSASRIVLLTVLFSVRDAVQALLSGIPVVLYTLALVLLTWSYSSCNIITAFAHSADESIYLSGSWQRDEAGWRFYNQWNYSYPSGQWAEYGGNSYYFMDNSYMATGWKLINNRWYYFNPYEGSKQGAMAVGWIHDPVSDTWYYTNQNGVMVTGWRKINGYWYYFDERPDHVLGQMAVSQMVDEVYVDSTGRMNDFN